MVTKEAELPQVAEAEAHREQRNQGHVDQGQHQNQQDQHQDQQDQQDLLLNHHAIQITTQITVSGGEMTVLATQNVTIKNVDGMEEIAKRSQAAVTCPHKKDMNKQEKSTITH